METNDNSKIEASVNENLLLNPKNFQNPKNPQNIQNKTPEKITKPALQRCLKRAGVKRISEPVFEIMRDIIYDFSSEIIKNIVIFVLAAKRKTAQIDDLRASLEMMKIYLAAGLNVNSKNTSASLHSCNSIGKSGPVKKSKPLSLSGGTTSEGIVKKPHRFRPGTRAIRSIDYHQKNSDCLAIPKANFVRLIRGLSSKYMKEIRFSEGVIDLLQLVVENHIINICKKAYECTLFAHRDTINSRDFDLVSKIMG